MGITLSTQVWFGRHRAEQVYRLFFLPGNIVLLMQTKKENFKKGEVGSVFAEGLDDRPGARVGAPTGNQETPQGWRGSHREGAGRALIAGWSPFLLFNHQGNQNWDGVGREAWKDGSGWRMLMWESG